MLKPEAEAKGGAERRGEFIKKASYRSKESGLKNQNRKNIKQIDFLLEKWYNIRKCKKGFSYTYKNINR